MDTHGLNDKNCQDLIKKQFLNDCKDCKTFCKFEVILSRFICGAYFEFYAAVSYG